MAWTGLPQLILIPFVPFLIKRFDVRHIAFLGIAIFAASCFMDTTLSLDSAGDQFWVPNIVRAIGQALVIPNWVAGPSNLLAFAILLALRIHAE